MRSLPLLGWILKGASHQERDAPFTTQRPRIPTTGSQNAGKRCRRGAVTSLSLAAHGSMALSGILQISFAAEARQPSTPSSASGIVPPNTPPTPLPRRALRPTARADQKYHDDLDPEPEAFRRHKNRFLRKTIKPSTSSS